jgi:hypothetical protein
MIQQRVNGDHQVRCLVAQSATSGLCQGHGQPHQPGQTPGIIAHPKQETPQDGGALQHEAIDETSAIERETGVVVKKIQQCHVGGRHVVPEGLDQSFRHAAMTATSVREE